MNEPTEPTELAAALTDAVWVALHDLTESETVRTDEVWVPTGAGVLTAFLPVRTATGTRHLAIRTTEPTARALAVRVLGGACPDPDAALVSDCLGELVNVVAGQTKTLPHGTPYHFALGTPAVAPDKGRRDRPGKLVPRVRVRLRRLRARGSVARQLRGVNRGSVLGRRRRDSV